MSETTPKKVYAAINRVQAALAKEGISKDRTANMPGGNYKFRGIDDIYNALSGLLAEHKLCVLPRMLTRQVVDRVSAKGNTLIYTVVEAEFDFVSSEDGSVHVVRTFGEAMDSGDKGCNKAMSAAYKYAAMQAFAIPTEGDNDTENQTHELAPPAPAKAPPKKAPDKPADAPKPSFVPEYAPIKQFLTDAGITKAEQAADAELVLRFCCHNVDIAKAKKDAKHAKEVDAAIQVALVEHKTPSAVLAAAKKLASSPV